MLFDPGWLASTSVDVVSWPCPMKKKATSVRKAKRSEFAERLVKWREAKGLSQAQAASVLGVSVRSLQNWEIGWRSPLLSSVGPVLERLSKDGL